jgi:hypothetical protein
MLIPWEEGRPSRPMTFGRKIFEMIREKEEIVAKKDGNEN